MDYKIISFMSKNKYIEVSTLFNKNSFDYYYLFEDHEIFNRPSFHMKIREFSKKIGGKKLIFDLFNLEWIERYKNKTKLEIPHSNECILEILDNTFVNKTESYGLLLFEYRFYDDTGKWMGYCNVGYDFGMVGCNKEVNNTFLSLIDPYEELSLKEKLNDINLNFVDKNGKPIFNIE